MRTIRADDIGAQAEAALLDGDGARVGDEPGLRRGIGGIAVMGERIDRGDENQRSPCRGAPSRRYGRVTWRAPERLIASSRSQAASIDLAMVSARVNPALLIRMSGAPAARSRGAQRVLRCGRVRQVEGEALGEIEPVHRAFLEVGTDYAGAGRTEHANERPTYAAASSRDQRALASRRKAGKTSPSVMMHRHAAAIAAALL